MENLGEHKLIIEPDADESATPAGVSAELCAIPLQPIPTSILRTTLEHFGSGKIVELRQDGERIVLKLDKNS